jgi:hypothetical protein
MLSNKNDQKFILDTYNKHYLTLVEQQSQYPTDIMGSVSRYLFGTVKGTIKEKGPKSRDKIKSTLELETYISTGSDINIIKGLLDSGADPNAISVYYGANTVLSEVVNKYLDKKINSNQLYDILSLLIHYGLDVNSSVYIGYTIPKKHILSIGWIILEPKLVKLLLESGADPNAVGYSTSPFELLCYYYQHNIDKETFRKIAKMLIYYGADIFKSQMSNKEPYLMLNESDRKFVLDTYHKHYLTLVEQQSEYPTDIMGSVSKYLFGKNRDNYKMKSRTARKPKRATKRTRRLISRKKSSGRSPRKSSGPSMGDEIMCPKHKKMVKVVNMYKDGGTLLLSCGCKDTRWNFIINRKRSIHKSRKSPYKSPGPTMGDEIMCPKHKKKVLVENMYLDGGTLLLSCGCEDTRWNRIINRKKKRLSFGRIDPCVVRGCNNVVCMTFVSSMNGKRRFFNTCKLHGNNAIAITSKNNYDGPPCSLYSNHCK